MVKVGRIDDPVSPAEVPTVAAAARIPGTRPTRHRRLVVAVLVVMLTVGGWWLIAGLLRSGDPGGRIMDELSPVATALPGYGTSSLPWTSQPSTSRPYLIKIEPHQDSCDGRAGTQGWSEVVVQGSFRWAGSNEALFARVDSGLSALGWNRTRIPGTTEAMWKKRLANGSVATTELTPSPLGNPTWEFVAIAPPAGRAATGC